VFALCAETLKRTARHLSRRSTRKVGVFVNTQKKEKGKGKGKGKGKEIKKCLG
jgi:hypothetical protein